MNSIPGAANENSETHKVGCKVGGWCLRGCVRCVDCREKHMQVTHRRTRHSTNTRMGMPYALWVVMEAASFDTSGKK